MSASLPSLQPGLTALLGPTNTGKTWHAIEVVLQSQSAVIGVPLRLLAREVYDTLCLRAGVAAVALVTGEERRAPAGARYFVCTTEAMVLDVQPHLVVVDEVQLCADRQRGHVFTDRVMHARGREATLLLGSDTMAPLLERLLPDCRITLLPRLSALRHTNPRRLGSLPDRTALVAFSTARVYALAEELRARQGGAALVFGALSPRTRNQQVAMYEAGEVRTLVATDAIGMGLNLDVHHVAFAGLSKFDGHEVRRLRQAELGQIAGRAGRYQRDGTFGTLSDIEPLSTEWVQAIQDQAFAPVRKIQWRNPALDFSSIERLLQTLSAPPPRSRKSAHDTGSGPFLATHDAPDHQALQRLARMEAVRKATRGAAAVRLLWDVSQVPDFRDTTPQRHVELLSWLYGLLREHAQVPEAELEARIERLDRVDGDIDALTERISWVRTWTYLSHKTGWLPDSGAWQARSREIEDRLSDALHERLTLRFVDHKVHGAGAPVVDLDLSALRVDEDDRVWSGRTLLGQRVGLDLRLEPLRAGDRRVDRSCRRALEPRVDRVIAGVEAALHVDREHRVCAGAIPLARLEPGLNIWEPSLRLLRLDLLDGPRRQELERQLQAWLQRWLAPLNAPYQDQGPLGRPGRGLLFRLQQGLGALATTDVPQLLRDLGRADRQALAARDVRFGREHLFIKGLLAPDAVECRSVLVSLRLKLRDTQPPTGASVSRDPRWPSGAYVAVGYPVMGERAVRADVVEVVASRLRQGPMAHSDLAALLECDENQAASVARALEALPTRQSPVRAPRRRAVAPSVSERRASSDTDW